MTDEEQGLLASLLKVLFYGLSYLYGFGIRIARRFAGKGCRSLPRPVISAVSYTHLRAHET